jgi:hypothetical protein
LAFRFKKTVLKSAQICSFVLKLFEENAVKRESWQTVAPTLYAVSGFVCLKPAQTCSNLFISAQICSSIFLSRNAQLLANLSSFCE